MKFVPYKVAVNKIAQYKIAYWLLYGMTEFLNYVPRLETEQKYFVSHILLVIFGNN